MSVVGVSRDRDDFVAGGWAKLLRGGRGRCARPGRSSEVGGFGIMVLGCRAARLLCFLPLTTIQKKSLRAPWQGGK